ncbi:MAG TPA: hypothetical protein VFE35_09180 [Candidatus Cybelea sp.]|jgi:hypothetical protein|nr:hypothetical protein [Candidatus Cybelea sp.]
MRTLIALMLLALTTAACGSGLSSAPNAPTGVGPVVAPAQRNPIKTCRHHRQSPGDWDCHKPSK